MLEVPQSVQMIEVGMRDGLQNEAVTLPTGMKLEIIQRLVQAGITEIQATSFVHEGTRRIAMCFRLCL